MPPGWSRSSSGSDGADEPLPPVGLALDPAQAFEVVAVVGAQRAGLVEVRVVLVRLPVSVPRDQAAGAVDARARGGGAGVGEDLDAEAGVPVDERGGVGGDLVDRAAVGVADQEAPV